MKVTNLHDELLENGFYQLLNQISQAKINPNQLVNLLDQIPIAISLTDTSANIQYVNHSFCRVTGYAFKETIGQKPSFLSYKTTPAEIYEGLWQEITKNRVWNGQLVNRKKDGSRYLAQVQIIPLTNNTGEICNYLGIQQDITNEYQHRVRLQQHDQINTAVLNTLPGAVALLDQNNNIILDNLAYKTLATDLGREPSDWVYEQVRKDIPAGPIKLDCEFDSPFGLRVFHCQILNLEMVDEMIDNFFDHQPLTGTLLVITEFSTEHRLREQQRIITIRQQTLETEAVCAMQETISAALHQLMSPMNVIDSAISLLQQKQPDAPALGAMKLAKHSGSTAIEQLKTIQPHSEYETRQSVNLNQIIHETLLIFSEQLMKKNIDLDLKLDSTLSAITGQPCRIRVALKQIIDNAIDSIYATNPDIRRIAIASSRDSHQMTITVEDTGPGVPDTHRIKVYQPFYSTRKGVSNGLKGMGLSIAQQIMNDHHGTIRMSRNEPSLSDENNKVTLIFPYVSGRNS